MGSCPNAFLKIYTKNCSNQTCDYWLITPNHSIWWQQTLCIERNIFEQWAIANQRVGNYKTTHHAMLITTNCLINQVIQYFLTNCFTFHTKFWILQVIKSDSCRISAIFLQYCFMIETQVLKVISTTNW